MRGNTKTTFVQHGASNHSDKQRANYDYYATSPEAIDKLFARETFSNYILEPAVGEGHLAKHMKDYGKLVKAQDITDRGYPETIIQNFFETLIIPPQYDIITNPPYEFAQEFIEHALQITMQGNKVAMFLKLTFLEGQKRLRLYRIAPPQTVYVFSKRISCARNGQFTKAENAVA